MRKLKEIYWMHKSIQSIEKEIRHIERIEGSEELQKALRDKQQNYIRMLQEAESMIDSIPDEKAKAIARMRYIEFMPWKKINKEIYGGYCDSSASRKYLSNRMK